MSEPVVYPETPMGSGASPATAPAIGQAMTVPPAFARWCRTGYGPNASDNLIAQAWQIATSDYREFWQSVDATEAQRDQLQAAHNAVAAKNAELAAELAGVREANGELDAKLAEAAQERDRLRGEANWLAEVTTRYRAVLEELATPVDVTNRDEGWLHDHGDDSCEFNGCDAAELHYRIVTARQALEG